MSYTTDCESIVKAGFLLQESKICVHIGYSNHRLDSTTGIVFDTPEVNPPPDEIGSYFGKAVLEAPLSGGLAS